MHSLALPLFSLHMTGLQSHGVHHCFWGDHDLPFLPPVAILTSVDNSDVTWLRLTETTSSPQHLLHAPSSFFLFWVVCWLSSDADSISKGVGSPVLLIVSPVLRITLTCKSLPITRMIRLPNLESTLEVELCFVSCAHFPPKAVRYLPHVKMSVYLWPHCIGIGELFRMSPQLRYSYWLPTLPVLFQPPLLVLTSSFQSWLFSSIATDFWESEQGYPIPVEDTWWSGFQFIPIISWALNSYLDEEMH